MVRTLVGLLFAGLFVLLALAMFGVFTLQVPAALQTRAFPQAFPGGGMIHTGATLPLAKL